MALVPTPGGVRDYPRPLQGAVAAKEGAGHLPWRRRRRRGAKKKSRAEREPIPFSADLGPRAWGPRPHAGGLGNDLGEGARAGELEWERAGVVRVGAGWGSHLFLLE